MGLQALEDNRKIGQMLYQSIADGHLHHAYLFESPKEKQGEELAVALYMSNYIQLKTNHFLFLRPIVT